MKVNVLHFLLLINCFATFAQQQQKVLAPGTTNDEQFGKSVALHGSFMIGGAPLYTGAANQSGGAFVYHNTGNAWAYQQVLTANDAATFDRMGNSVALHGNVMVVGASLADIAGNIDAGAAYIFRYNGTNWVFEQKITASNSAPGDEFGHAVSVYQGVIAIGAFRANNGGTDRGSVYIFRFDGSSWNEEQIITMPGGDDYDFFGYALSLHNDVLAIGAYLDDDMGINSGSVFIYRDNGLIWNMEQKLTAANGLTGDSFGFSVSVNDTLCAIGAYSKTVGGSLSAGGAYVFSYSSGSWSQNQYIPNPDPTLDDWFGFDVKHHGKTLVIGTLYDDELGFDSGCSYIYRHNGTNWQYELKLMASDGANNDEFGHAVAIDEYTVVSTSPKRNDNGLNTGAAYFIDLCTYKPSPSICLVTADTSSLDNIVTWTKPNTTFIDSFSVFRLDNGILIQQEEILYNSPSRLNISSIDNRLNYYQYRVSSTNVCQLKSDTSLPHQTFILNTLRNTDNSVTLNWTAASGFSFPYYRIWRDDSGIGNWQLIFATLNSQFTYSDMNAPLDNNLRYLVEVQKTGTCNTGNGSFSSSLSNISVPAHVRTDENNMLSFRVYPNPTSSILHVEAPYNFRVIDPYGREILQNKASANLQTIDVGYLSPGVYFLEFDLGENKRGFYKWVKQ